MIDATVKSNLSEIRALIQSFGVIKVYLFGSASVGNISGDSDLDFTVSFNPKLTYTEYGDNYFKLIYALQKLLKKM